MAGNINPQTRNQFQIPDLRNIKEESPLDYDLQWNPVCIECARFLPVAMDEDEAVGRKDDGKQSRRRLLFHSGST